MKKILAVFLCVLMCGPISPMALAANSRDISFETSLASQMKELGLFRGTAEHDDGTADFDLSREPSRVEALIMLVRALGKGAEAEAYPKTHPFSDVPAWADGYVSYAYDHGLTNGHIGYAVRCGGDGAGGLVRDSAGTGGQDRFSSGRCGRRDLRRTLCLHKRNADRAA